MIRDPLYRAIVERLNGDLDGDIFERCAQDLLREAYPTLVAMVGGDDAGFDAAIGTPEGPFPLCCTVDRAGPLANFRKNIQTYLRKRPAGPKRAVIATPRRMTSRMKRNLDRAGHDDYGVVVVNVHDQADFALRLYRSPGWRKELLGLSGAPPALSALPRRTNRQERPSLVGREEDLAWLRSRAIVAGPAGDCLLIGQPGSGKTYLHEQMALNGEALFVVEKDLARVADAVREQQPRVVVVDDAHLDLHQLRDLAGLRHDIHADYALHVNCWPHAQREVVAALGLPEVSVRQLHALTRQKMRELLAELSVRGPDNLLTLLLDRAEGKPGLAAVLVAAVKREEYDRVWSGDAVADALLSSNNLGGLRSRTILAALSLGGDSGVSIDEAAQLLKLAPVEVSEVVSDLAAGGVVEEVTSGWGQPIHRLAVRPPVLRGLLARECFYSGAGRTDPALLVERLREDTDRVGDLASTLCDAQLRGAGMPVGDLFELVRLAGDVGSAAIWAHFAYTGESACDMIFRLAPHAIHDAAPGLLHHRPQLTLRLLLVAESSGVPALFKAKPSDQIRRWLDGDAPAEPSAIVRRRLLMDAVEQQVTAGTAAPDRFAWALCIALSPEVPMHRVTPEDANKINLFRGVLPLGQLGAVASLWPRALEVIRGADALAEPVRDLIHKWCFSSRLAFTEAVPDEVTELMETCARQMLVDVVSLPKCDRATRTWARDLARQAQLGLTLRVDRTFDRVFGSRDHHVDYMTRLGRRARVLKAVADQYLARPPAEAMQELAQMEKEAASFGGFIAWDRRILYQHIAERCDDGPVWLGAAVKSMLPADQVDAMMLALRRRGVDMTHQLREMLGTSLYRRLAALGVLSLPEPPSEMLEAALASLPPVGPRSGGGQDLAFVFVNLGPPVPTMLRLLEHDNLAVSAAAALAEWRTPPEGEVRSELRRPWRRAILQAGQEDDYLLLDVLEAEPALAAEWAAQRIRDASKSGQHPHSLWKHKRAILKLVPAMDLGARSLLLDLIDEFAFQEEVVHALLGRERELHDGWLRRHMSTREAGQGNQFALEPLCREVDDDWITFAVAALDAGYSPSEVARCIGRHSSSGFGPRSDYYREYATTLEALIAHEDERLRAVGRAGNGWATAKMNEALASEQLAAVRGGR